MQVNLSVKSTHGVVAQAFFSLADNHIPRFIEETGVLS
jgi:hypothetical protein